MRAVVIGDIGWEHFYHLGDEAMTEVAIEQLRQRGFNEITVVAAEPSVASKMYNVRSVPRIGFERQWGDKKLNDILEDVSSIKTFQHDAWKPLFDAMSKADLAVIAGGGNLNSTYYHHVYERVAFSRIAKKFGVKLVVTSQTVGPALEERELQFIREIVENSAWFGVRERSSYDLLLNIGCSSKNIVNGLDDALLLETQNSSMQTIADIVPQLSSTTKYAVASFTSDAGESGLSNEEYYRQIAVFLDEVVRKLDCDVVLAPHIGSFDSDVKQYDVRSDSLIKAFTKSGRVSTAPILRAKEYLSLIHGSLCTISTRYHPLVFAPGERTLPIGIALSDYSVVRMEGALSNVGLSGLTFSLDSLDCIVPAFQSLNNDHHLKTKLEILISNGKQHISRWWDLIASVDPSQAPEQWQIPEQTLSGEWHRRNADILSVSVKLRRSLFEVQQELRKLSAHVLSKEAKYDSQLLTLNSRNEKISEKLVSVTQRAETAENRKAVKVVDAVAGLLRSIRRDANGR